VDDYKVGDLSSLLGFNDADSDSTLFKKSSETSDFAEKFAAAKSKGDDIIKKKKKTLPLYVASIKSNETANDSIVVKKKKNNKKIKKGKKIGNEGATSTASAHVRTAEVTDATGEVVAERGDDTIAGDVVSSSCEGKEASTDVIDPTATVADVDATSPPPPPPPPPTLESKHARKKRKRREENALLEEREADAFDGEEPGKKKKKKKKTEDDDDDDDSEDEAEELEKKKKKNRTTRDPADDERTIFVGNLPKTIDKNRLLRLFGPFGKVTKCRVRGAVSNDPKQSKKVAAITKNIHNKLDSLFAYVVFEQIESVAKAVAKMNGAEFQGRHLRVDVCKTGESGTCNDKLSVFVGNLPYDVAEEALRTLFHDSCGDVSRVRCIRDPATRMGKGFGYVEFRSAGAVKEAVGQSEQLTLNGRPLRIKRATLYGKNHDGKINNKFMGDAGKRRKMKKPGVGGGGGDRGKFEFKKRSGKWKDFSKDKKKKKTMVKL